MNNLTSYLFDIKGQPKEVKWFKNAMALFLLYKVGVYIYLFEELFSSNKFIYNQSKSVNFLVDTSYYLSNHYTTLLAVFLIIVVAIISILELLNKTNVFARFVLWIVILNFNNFLFQTLTAGDYLLNQMLFFSVFLTTKNHSNTMLNQLLTAFYNISLLGIKTQVCLVYILAAWFKIYDIDWLQGTAIYSVFKIPEYSNSLLASLPQWFCALSTYLVLIYQLSFVVLVWIKPLKKYILGFGILQHLIIAFGLGIFSFGIIMIISYILFLNYDYKSLRVNA